MNHPYESSLFDLINTFETFFHFADNLASESDYKTKELDDTNVVADVDYREIND